MSRNYIPIERRFSLIGEDATSADIYEFFEGGLNWKKLLQESCIVILASAGMGKTTECKEQVKALREQGQYAWFVNVEDVADQELNKCLRSHEEEEFNEWCQSSASEIGYFFLDSVDEARLRKRNFESALKNLERSIGGERKKRAHVIITCRSSDWLVQEDLSLVKEYFCLSGQREIRESVQGGFETEDSSPQDPLVVEMKPLETTQAKYIAQKMGAENVEHLFNQIEEKGIEFLTERPMDIGPLVRLYNRRNALGSYEDIIKENISLKLEETTNSRRQFARLNVEELSQGCEKIAAALILCQKNKILLPDNPISPQLEQEVIHAESFFPSWTPKQISDFLTHSIFSLTDGDGQINFYHRSIKEYLAARWFQKMINKGCPLNKIQVFLFGESHVGEFVFDVMKPVAGWLAVWNKKIRKKLLKIDPLILFQEGDSSQLTPKERVKLFWWLVNHARENIGFSFRVDKVHLKRFAAADLVEPISRALHQCKDHEGTREFILDLIRIGGLSQCAELALRFARNPEFGAVTHIAAIRVLALAESQDTKRSIIQHFVEKEPTRVPDVFMSLVEGFFPDFLSIDQLCALIKSIEKKKYSVDMTYRLHDVLEKNCPENERLLLLQSLVDILRSPPFVKDNHCPISERHSWLADPMLQLIGRVLKQNVEWNIDSPNMLSVIADAIFIIKMAGRYTTISLRDINLDKLLSGLPKLRQTLYWKAIQRGRKEGKDVWASVYVIYDVATPSISDIDWLIEDINKKEESQDRLDILESLFIIWRQSGEAEDIDQKIRNAIKSFPELKEKYNQLLAALERSKQQEAEERPWERAEREREAAQQAVIRRSRVNLEKELSKLQNGTHVNGLTWLWERMEHSGASFTRINWDSLIPDFGEDIVNAAKNGIKVYWKSNAAIKVLQGKFPESGSIPWPAVLGLSAIGLESQATDWAKSLTEDEVKQATKIALFEINGLPEWIGDLYDEHPELVLGVLRARLTVEAQGEDDSLIRNLGKLSKIILESLTPYLLQLLEEGKASQNLDDIVSILLRSEALDKKRFLQLVQRQFEENKKKSLWLTALFHLDAQLALKRLKTYIQENPDRADGFIQSILGSMSPTVFHDRGTFHQSKYKDYLDHRDVVFDLTRLAYTHIRLADDVDRMEGGSYTPDVRDFAQEARGYFLKKLTEFPGKETYKLLRKLASYEHIKDNSLVRSYILRLAEGRAQRDSDFCPWTVEQVNEFEQKAGEKSKFHKITQKIQEHPLISILWLIVSILGLIVSISGF